MIVLKSSSNPLDLTLSKRAFQSTSQRSALVVLSSGLGRVSWDFLDRWRYSAREDDLSTISLSMGLAVSNGGTERNGVSLLVAVYVLKIPRAMQLPVVLNR